MPNGPIRSTPQYNPASGFCETWPLDEYNTCPERYIYSQWLRTCVDLPRCTGNYTYDLGTKSCVPIGNQTQQGSGTNGTTQYDQICAVDKNGDGDISEDELAECITADDGSKICPLDAAPCRAKNTVPDCPSGYTYNGQTKTCQSNPTCDPGFTYDGINKICTKQVECPNGGVLQNINGQWKCVATGKSNCPPGYTTDPTRGVCVSPSTLRCPSGWRFYENFSISGGGRTSTNLTINEETWTAYYHDENVNFDFGNCNCLCYCTNDCACYNGSCYCGGICECYNDSYGYYSNSNYCYCPFGELCNYRTCNVSINGCSYYSDQQSSFSCVFHTASCTEMWNCMNGCAYSTSYSFDFADCVYNYQNVCVWDRYVAFPKNCSQGQYLNSQTGLCEFCPSGYTYDTNLKLCLTDPCSSGSTFDSNLQACVQAPSCIQGGSFNQDIGKCEGSAACPSNATLTNDGCLIGYFCPYGNYPCKPVNGVMECSASQCLTTSELQDPNDDELDNPSDYKDDGLVDEKGQCLGQVYIFNGETQRCKYIKGLGSINCCKSELAKGKIYDSTGSTGGNFALLKYAAQAIKYSYDIVYFGYQFATGTVHVYVGESVIILSKSADFVNPWVIDQGSIEWKAFQNLFRDKGISPSPGTFIDFASGDQTVAAAMKSYVEALGPHIAWSITHLAISGLIKDPQVAALVNLAADAVAYAFYSMGWISTSLVSPIGLAVAVIGVIVSFLFGEGCDKEDIITVTKRESGRCHYVGEKCKKKALGLKKKCKKYYCCFNSKLARIIHEQGRPQLNTDIRNWGDEDSTNCRGFTPEEFASLDFDKIDLSEYFEDITRNIPNDIETNVQKFFNDSIQTQTSR